MLLPACPDTRLASKRQEPQGMRTSGKDGHSTRPPTFRSGKLERTAEHIEMIPFDCPRCGRKFEEPLTRLAEDSNVTCSDCGKVFHLEF
jgi:DNA-directed RNA polymerase subunit RPC12/RpoP